MHVARSRDWRRALLPETDVAAGAGEEGCHTRIQAKPDRDRATLEDFGRTVLVVWTITAGLRVSPSLAAAGFQEMSPAFALDVASKGDAITGINRADSASVRQCSVSSDSARDG